MRLKIITYNFVLATSAGRRRGGGQRDEGTKRGEVQPGWSRACVLFWKPGAKGIRRRKKVLKRPDEGVELV